MSDTENSTTDINGAMADGEVIQTPEISAHPAQNDPEIVAAPLSESGQMAGNDPIAPPKSPEIATEAARVASGTFASEPAVASPSAIAPITSGRAEPLPVSTEPSMTNPQPANLSIATPITSEATESLLAPPGIWRGLLLKAREKIQWRKRKKLDRLLAEIAKKGKITNDAVEKLLHISDKTAERYCAQLLREGKIKTNGKNGKALEYLVN
jgi:hypothetical protein